MDNHRGFWTVGRSMGNVSVFQTLAQWLTELPDEAVNFLHDKGVINLFLLSEMLVIVQNHQITGFQMKELS